MKQFNRLVPPRVTIGQSTGVGFDLQLTNGHRQSTKETDRERPGAWMNSTPIDLLLDLLVRSIEGQKIANNLRTRSIKWRTSRSTIDQKARATNRRDRSMAPRGGVDEFGTNLLITRSMGEVDRRPKDSKTTCGRDQSNRVRVDLQSIKRPVQ